MFEIEAGHGLRSVPRPARLGPGSRTFSAREGPGEAPRADPALRRRTPRDRTAGIWVGWRAERREVWSAQASSDEGRPCRVSAAEL
jgi:hypothetical protein